MKEFGLLGIIFVVIGSAQYMGSIHFEEPGKSGADLPFYVNLHNPTTRTDLDIQVMAVVMETGDYTLSRKFTLDDFDNDDLHFILPLPRNMAPGLYTMKVVASSEDLYDSTYASFVVS